jgi:hypothetical protein
MFETAVCTIFERGKLYTDFEVFLGACELYGGQNRVDGVISDLGCTGAEKPRLILKPTMRQVTEGWLWGGQPMMCGSNVGTDGATVFCHCVCSPHGKSHVHDIDTCTSEFTLACDVRKLCDAEQDRRPRGERYAPAASEN